MKHSNWESTRIRCVCGTPTAMVLKCLDDVHIEVATGKVLSSSLYCKFLLCSGFPVLSKCVVKIRPNGVITSILVVGLGSQHTVSVCLNSCDLLLLILFHSAFFHCWRQQFSL